MWCGAAVGWCDGQPMVFADTTYRQARGSGAGELLVAGKCKAQCRHVPRLSAPAANEIQRMGS